MSETSRQQELSRREWARAFALGFWWMKEHLPKHVPSHFESVNTLKTFLVSGGFTFYEEDLEWLFREVNKPEEMFISLVDRDLLKEMRIGL